MKRLKLFSVLIIVSIVGISWYVVDSNSADFGVLSWTIPELAVTTSISSGSTVSGTKISDIICSASMQSTIVDANGRTITVKSSQLYRNNPLLALTATTSGNPIAGVVNQVYFNCNAGAGGITLEPSNLTFVVLAQKTAGGSYSTIFKESVNTGKVDFAKGSTTAKSVASYSIYGKDIEAKIGSTVPFKTNLKFQVYGNFNVHWTGYSTPLYKLPVGINDIPTDYSANVNPAYVPTTSTTPTNVATRDTDGDGLIDIYDKCATSKENYNNYLDSDGCPDSPPTTVPSGGGSDEQPVTPTTCPSGQKWDGNKCVTIPTNDIPSQLKSTKLKYIRSTVFNTQTVRSNINDNQGFDIGFSQLALVRDSSGSKDFIKYVLEPHIDFDDSYLKQLKPVTVDFTYQPVIVTLDGKEHKLTPKLVKGGLVKNSATMTLTPVEVTYDEIKNNLQTIISSNEITNFVLTVLMDGTFTVKDELSGKSYNGIVKGSVTYPLQYNPNQPFDPKEPCQGLSGLEILQCKSKIIVTSPSDCEAGEEAVGVGINEYVCIDPDATGGYCQGMTSLQCYEKGKGQTNSCNGIADLLGLCVPPVDTPQECPVNHRAVPSDVEGHYDCIPIVTGGSGGSSGGTITEGGLPKVDTTAITGICEDSVSIQECLAKAGLSLNPSSNEPNYQLVFYALIALVFIIIIVLIIKKARK